MTLCWQWSIAWRWQWSHQLNCPAHSVYGIGNGYWQVGIFVCPHLLGILVRCLLTYIITTHTHQNGTAWR